MDRAETDHLRLLCPCGALPSLPTMELNSSLPSPPPITAHCPSNVSAVWTGRDNNDAGCFRTIGPGAPRFPQAYAPRKSTAAASPAARPTDLRELSAARLSRSAPL